ncbi:MAG: branched-chain amino acid ABC transporter permease [Eubacterium sp.]
MNTAKIKNRFTKKSFTSLGIVLVMFVIVQIISGTGNMTSSFEGLLVPLCYYIIMAVSLNLTVGILGELSLGHAGFMCVGAFASGIFTRITQNSITNVWIRFPIAILVGILAAAIFGVLIGGMVLRLQGDYLAIVTLAFGEIIKNILNVLYLGVDSKGVHISFKDVMSLNLEEDGDVIVKGAQGITKIPSDTTFIVAFILVVITLIIILNFINSRTGRAVMAVRDNKIAAESVGINISKYRLLAFTVSAALAGMAGAIYAHNIVTVVATPAKFGYNMSIMILVYVVLGGIGNISGSIISTVVLVMLPEMLRSFSEYRMLIYALLLIIIMICTWNPKISTKIKRYADAVKQWIFSIVNRNKKQAGEVK